MKAPYRVAIAALSPLLLAQVALAEVSVSSGPDPRLCSEDNLSQCLNGVGSAVVAPDALRVPTSRRAANRRTPSASSGMAATLGSGGVNAGDSLELAGFSIWTAFGRSHFESTASNAPYAADNSVFTLGVDRSFAERWLVGMTLSYETTDTSTFYNGGGQQTDGFGIAPYAVVALTDILSIDMAGGISFLDTSQQRIGQTPTGGVERIRSSFDSERWFGTVNLNAARDYGLLALSGRIGYLYLNETQDAYSETGTGTAAQALRPRAVGEREVSLGQAYAGVEVAGRFERAMPYLGALYRNDLSREDGSAAGGLPNNVGQTLTRDRDEIEFTAGVRWFGERVSGSVEYLKTLDRTNFENDTFQALLRVAL
jgi:hypothetical protein